MLEWPIRRQLHQDSSTESPLGVFLQTFQSSTALIQGKNFQTLVEAVTEACRLRSDPQDAITHLSDWSTGPEEEAESLDFDSATLAFACVESLRKIPTAATWSYLWSLVWHSATLMDSLPMAVTTVAKEDPLFRSKFLEIATEVVKEAATNPGRRANPRERELFPQLQADWNENSSLLNIWWGLREGRSLQFRDDDGILRIVANIDLEAFMNLLSTFNDYPYPISAALEAAQAGWSFSRWRAIFSLAPVAFDENKNWNGSVIIPLLLVIARDQVLQGKRKIGAASPEDEVRKAETEIEELAKEIAKSIAIRPDASPCAERWATWLMRQTMGGVSDNPLPYPTDARSNGYVDSALLDAIILEFKNTAWSIQVAGDAEPWEHWCHRCVLVIKARAGTTPMPGIGDFLEQWTLNPDEWALQRGQQLRERASFFEAIGKRPDAYATRLLAIPLAEAQKAEKAWLQIWEGTHVIREIIEFGDHEIGQDEGMGTVPEASQLMKFVFGLGLMMLECIIDSNCKIQYDRQTSLENLFAQLTDAVKEMSNIERLAGGYWSEAFRHLAIRRALWVNSDLPLEAIFQEHAKPSFGDFLRELSEDAEALLILLNVALKNNVRRDILKTAIDESKINLLAQIDLADRLLVIDRRRAGIGPEQIATARSFLDRQVSSG
jgi:hypothetical protein